MKRFRTIAELLAGATGSATALAAPGADPLTYDGLRANIARCVQALNDAGIGRGDRVAIVLPNGPQMAAAFAAVASAAAAAPLNPAYRADEFEFYLADLSAKALLVECGSTSPSIEVARKLGVQVIELRPQPTEGAGAFVLEIAPGVTATTAAGYAKPDDLALILHTSGTTSRPKIVPLTQTNVCASACNVRDTIALNGADRSLNVMPLFHIHGLIAGLLAPLAAGSSIFCTPGFNALKFFAWMQEARPTWYTAVPTMHQAIVGRAGSNRDDHRRESVALHPLIVVVDAAAGDSRDRGGVRCAADRVLRHDRGRPSDGQQSAAAARDAFQAASALPPARKWRSWTRRASLLPAGETGEIVIRGPNVTSGYENNPTANAEAFVDGWFRTGDQGVVDAEDYLWITGRLKEIINRGGEKVSPREVDEVLMDHPAVQQAVTFAVPHDKLGEEVGAAVVLREGATATERELRDFVAQRLTDFKVPRKSLFLDEIPKGATGKLQRIGLAAKLGLA